MNNSDTTFQTNFDTKLAKLMETAYSVFEVDLTAEIGQQKAMFLDASFPTSSASRLLPIKNAKP